MCYIMILGYGLDSGSGMVRYELGSDVLHHVK